MPNVDAYGYSDSQVSALGRGRGEVSGKAYSENVFAVLAKILNPSKVLGCWVVNDGKVRVEFDRPMRNDSKLIDKDNYRMSVLPWPPPAPGPGELYEAEYVNLFSTPGDPRGIAVLNNFVFVSSISGVIRTIVINPTTGELESNPFSISTSNIQYFTVHPSGEFLYVSSYDTASIIGYSINPSTGELTYINSISLGSPSDVSGFAPPVISDDGLFLYAAGNSWGAAIPEIKVVSVNPITGFLSVIQSLSVGSVLYCGCMQLNPNAPSGTDWFYMRTGIDGVYKYTRNRTTGLIAYDSKFLLDLELRNANWFAFSPSHKIMYVASPSGDLFCSYSVGNPDGSLTRIPEDDRAGTAFNHPFSVSPDGKFLAIPHFWGNIEIFTLDPDTERLIEGSEQILTPANNTSSVCAYTGDSKFFYAPREFFDAVQGYRVIGPSPALRPGPAELVHTKIIPQGIAHPTHVDIKLSSEMSIDAEYVCEVETEDGPTDLHGQPFDEEFNSGSFVGEGAIPLLFSVQSVSSTLIDVIFNENMYQNFAIMNPNNYIFDGDLVVLKIVSVKGNTVRLQTTEQTPGQIYTLQIGEP